MSSISIRTDLEFDEIAGVTAKPAFAWVIVGDQEDFEYNQKNGLGAYFSQACVDGAAFLLEEAQDASLLLRLQAELTRWWNTSSDGFKPPSAWLPTSGHIVIARYPAADDRALWVIAETGGAGGYWELSDLLTAPGAVEVFLACHMALDEHEQVVNESGCHVIWDCLESLKQAPSPPVRPSLR